MKKFDFYKNIIENEIVQDSQEVRGIIMRDMDDSEFYELCQNFVDIALNGETFKENGEIFRLNRYVDIDKAKPAIRSFIKKYGIMHVDQLFEMIQARFPESKSPDDTRQVAGIIREEHQGSELVGYYGTFVDLFQIPTWDKIKKRIIAD